MQNYIFNTDHFFLLKKKKERKEKEASADTGFDPTHNFMGWVITRRAKYETERVEI